jgi:hypothetical protein
MENLVLCPCGHSLVLHDYTGCSGDRLRTCGCVNDRHAALEAAVDSARTASVYTASAYATRSTDAA